MLTRIEREGVHSFPPFRRLVMNSPAKYPVGVQDFAEIIKGGYVYSMRGNILFFLFGLMG